MTLPLLSCESKSTKEDLVEMLVVSSTDSQTSLKEKVALFFTSAYCKGPCQGGLNKISNVERCESEVMIRVEKSFSRYQKLHERQTVTFNYELFNCHVQSFLRTSCIDMYHTMMDCNNTDPLSTNLKISKYWIGSLSEDEACIDHRECQSGECTGNECNQGTCAALTSYGSDGYGREGEPCYESTNDCDGSGLFCASDGVGIGKITEL